MGNANSGRLISIELVQRVARRLKHLPQSQVADEAGIDLGTVQKIARGEHPHQKALRTARRCPGCGGLLIAPSCLKCELEGNADGLRYEEVVDEVMADRAFVEGLGLPAALLPGPGTARLAVVKDSPDKPGARAA